MPGCGLVSGPAEVRAPLVVALDKVNLDITWMKGPRLDDADSGLPPEVIAEEIVREPASPP